MLTGFFVAFKRVTVTEEPDGLGGTVRTFADGASFSAGIFANAITEPQIAQQVGQKATYTIVHGADVALHQHDIVRRVSDGRLFRVTSDSSDHTEPAPATMTCRWVSAEVVDP